MAVTFNEKLNRAYYRERKQTKHKLATRILEELKIHPMEKHFSEGSTVTKEFFVVVLARIKRNNGRG